MDRLQTASLNVNDEQAFWESLASACTPPFRRLGSFVLVGFTAFIALTTAIVLLYNVLGTRYVEGQGVMVPQSAFYSTMAFSALLVLGGYASWMAMSARAHAVTARSLREHGMDPLHPTLAGLRAYSDEQLLALRARYESLRDPGRRDLFERTFGFESGDAFELAPLSVLPGTFEMNALRVEWESNLLLTDRASLPRLSWWRESRLSLLPRQADGILRLIWARLYTDASVRLLKRRYGYRTDRWHETVPEGKLWDAVRDHEDSRRIHAALNRR